MRRRPGLTTACLAAGAVALACGAWWVVGERRRQIDLAQARREVASGRFDQAGRRLALMAARDPGDGEAAYLLGLCENARGRTDPALDAWSRVPAASPFAARANLAAGRVLIVARGRFAEAERALDQAGRGDDLAAVEARRLLGQLYYWEGRADDLRRLLQRHWARSPDGPGDLRDLWLNDSATMLVDEVRRAVEKATRLAPDDDRVWLARSHLFMQEGRNAEALERLDACLARRPDDPAVWRARLRWAVAADRADEAARALARLPADLLDPAEVLALRAWFAARRHDLNAERDALERLVNENPGDSRALERLAALAADSDRAAVFRQRKGEVDRAKDRYGRLLGSTGPIAAPFDELAALAETLGRWFDARGWLILALRRDPGSSTLREALGGVESRLRTGRSREGDSLAQLLADETPRAAEPAPSPGRSQNALVPYFEDDAEAAGLRFVFDNGRSRLRQLPETSSGGVALLDYDGDGWLDVYVLQGGPFPPTAGPPSGEGDRLFHNKGDGKFEDATESSGIARFARGYSHGVAVGDYDNDGRPDLFVTRWRAYSLYRNRGGGAFEDVTEQAGFGGDRDWPTSAAWADFDNDGDLDLYVCHYLVWDSSHPTLCRAEGSDQENRDARPPFNYCTPHQFRASPDHLFRNDGGKFRDVSAEAGITAADTDGRGFGVVAADLDGDGWIDLYVANDTTANFLFHNRGELRFEETGLASGAGCNASGGFQAGMGVACGDLDGDGLPDLVVTNFYGESTSFYRNRGNLLFEDQTAGVGIAAPTRFSLGFGVVMFDANNDGRPDLMTSNGHVNDDRPKYPYAMPAQLLVGRPSGLLDDVSRASGPPWRVARVGRGLACGDLDNDGRVDAVLVAQKSPLAYFHNRTPHGNHVTFGLEGTASNRDAVGARLTVVAGGRRRTAWRIGGGSFQSASSPRLHFGLSTEDRVEEVEVRWPSGKVERHRGLKGGTGYRLREGSVKAEPLVGYGR